MKNQTKNLSRKRRVAFYVIVLLIPAITISAIYIVYTGYRTRPLYLYVKSNQHGWIGKIHRADAELGYVPVPNSLGAETLPIGDDIPVRYDNYGFRVPVDNKEDVSVHRPVVLTLGCSFTYGAVTPAEETYPYLVGQHLGGTSRNAGVSAYGLSQMMLLARKLVPLHKPDYLLVQYSPWLVSRAQSPFAPSFFGKIPTPYFFVSRDELRLQPPVFQTKVMDLAIDRYRNKQTSFADKISFLWHVGLPLYAHDDFNMSLYKIKSVFGLVPTPAGDGGQIEKYVYEEIAKVARENGAKLVIVILGRNSSAVQMPKNLFPPDSVVVNAQDALLEHLPVVDDQNYWRVYGHWRGSPPVVVDLHPNENAHRIIAEAIIHKLQTETDPQPKTRTRAAARGRSFTVR
jgi:hypothetical protein